MDKDKESGYTNTFTFHAGLILDNDHPLYDAMNTVLAGESDDLMAADLLKGVLEERIEEFFEVRGSKNYESEQLLIQELLSCAMRQVNWQELVEERRKP